MNWKSSSCDALLGTDLGLTKFLFKLQEEQQEAAEEVRLTRAQAARLKDQEKQEAEQDAQAAEIILPIDDVREVPEVEPVPLTQTNLLSQVENGDETTEQAQYVAEREGPEFSEPEQGETVDLLLPVISREGTDTEKLIKEQRDDSTLTKHRDMADRGVEGYQWEKSVLIHNLEKDDSRVFERIVIPSSRRKDVLKLAHSDRMAGHFSPNRTEGALQRVLTWPGVARDIREWC